MIILARVDDFIMFDVINKSKFNFVDQQGWESYQDEGDNTLTHQRRFNNLVKESEKEKRKARRRQVASQTPQAAKKTIYEPRQTRFSNFGLPHLVPQAPIRVPIKNIDFQENHRRRPKWTQRSSISAKFEKADRSLTKSSELGSANPEKRYSEERKQRIEMGTRRLYFQFKNSGEVDRVTQRYIEDFLNQRGRLTLRQGRKMFEIPSPDKNFYA